MPGSSLENTISSLESKADDYQTAVNFEAKLQEYKNDASSLQTSLHGLQTRLQEAERFNTIYTEAFGYDSPSYRTPETLNEARRQSRRVLDKSEEDYWELIDEDRADEHEAEIQTARSSINSARQELRSKLNDEQQKWETRVQSARHIQRLMSESRDTETLLTDVETFVQDTMWDDDQSPSSLKTEWRALHKKWTSGVVVDWSELGIVTS
ncbi:hypothetical protein ACFQL1_16335 [Halomicroarcula sp. GCM10025709]|uniref:hypothetical protein n=1 Tax=Halomicroarcula sp. GCM10025709 TaxID=3252669 RepID=UPI0036189496